MTRFTGPLYEISLVNTGAASPELDDWLKELARRALRETGIEDARIFDSGVDDQGRAVHVCQFRAADDNALDELLDGFFAEVDAEIAEHFGDHVLVSSRTMREDDSNNLPAVESPNCLNCGTRLRGQYCGVCGQRARNRLISLWELLREAFGDLLELDSRIWRTLVPLLIRPGQLTHDYLQGRRARYMPPFRTYLVLSVLFFVVAFFDPQEDLGLLNEPEPKATPEEIAEQDARRAEAKKDIVTIDDGSEGWDCESGEVNFENVPGWIQRRLTPERVIHLCEEFDTKRGVKAFVDGLVDNIAVALFVLLPFMAFVLKALYPLSRRYFVEHLLFFLHFHAFFFLLLILLILFSGAIALVNIEGTITTLIIVAASFYVPVYLYKGMRRVYQQGRLVTFAKYVTLLVTYAFGASLTMLAAAIFSAATI
ncbi:MAG: DUF4286 family protein [Proteobacteria bacterium]|nr:DUF4286 family protein [Pseudomonadota bacterium]